MLTSELRCSRSCQGRVQEQILALAQARFYTGFPDAGDDIRWNKFWTRKLLAINRQGVWTFSRQLRYRNRQITIGDGAVLTKRIGEEKGIDVRLAIDLIRLAHQKRYDVAVVFSQDQDLSEVAKEIRIISKEQARWIKMVSAFPYKPNTQNIRGINGTDWMQIDQETYDSCIDHFDYRK